MKFWFCEKCGKRITEADFPPGLDPEKVSGHVICKACVVPLPSPAAISKTKITRISGPSHPTAHVTHSGPSTHSTLAAAHKPAPPPDPASARKANIILGLVALLIVGVVVFLMLNIDSGAAKPPPKVVNAPTSATGSKTNAGTQAAIATTSTAATANPTLRNQTQTTTDTQPALPFNRPDPEQPANDAFDALNKKLPALQPKEQAAALEEFVNRFPDSIVAARANRMLQELRIAEAEGTANTQGTAAKPPETPKVTPPQPAEAPPPAKVEEEVKIDESLAAYTAFQASFLAALTSRQLDRAATLLTSAQKDPLLASRQPLIMTLQPSIDWVKELDAAPAKGAAMLKDVDNFTLPIAHGEPLRIGRSAPFKLDEFKDGTLSLSNKGLMLPVTMASLPDESRTKLAVLALGDGGHARLVRGLSELLAASDKQLEAAVSSVRALLQREQKNLKAAAPASELSCLQQFVSDAEAAYHERAAAGTWKEIAKNFADIDADSGNPTLLAPAIENFRAAYETTFFAMKNAAEIKARKVAAETTLFKGLAAWWKFEETDGTAAIDSSGQKHNAALVNGPQRVAGKFGNAISLNGVDQYVQLPEKLIFARSSLSLCLWFKTTTGGVIFGYQNVSVPTQPGNYVPSLYIDNEGRLRGEFWVNGSQHPRSAAACNDGKWHHIVLCASDDSQTLYLDGTDCGTIKAKLEWLAMTFSQLGTCYGGRWPNFTGGFWYFKGELDDVRLYDRMLTPAEVGQLAGK